MAALCRSRLAAQSRWLSTITSIRGYGSSAAATQFDYEEEEEEFERDAAWRYGDRAISGTDGSATGRGVQWVIMGDPMAKKHVYAERLSKLLQVPHISMGTLVRQELHPLSSLYKQIANAVNQGKLVPEDIIFGLLSKRLEEGYSRGETGFILDGIPRSRIQAEILDQIADIDLVVNFKCTEDCLLNQHMRTGIYSPGKEFLSTSKSGYPSSSSSDAEGGWRDKLSMHAQQSKPIEDYYRQQKKLLDFQAASAPGETWQGLLAALHLQHMNAISCSQKLTA